MTWLLDDLERVLDELFAEVSGWEIAAAILILVVSWPVALVAGWMVKKLLLLLPGVNLGVATLGKRAVQMAVWLIGFAWALSVLNIGPGFVLVIVITLIAAAVAIAQPLFRNMAASVVVPYWPGDQIETHHYAGTVAEVNPRQTVIETRDRRKIYIPNSDVLANPIVVFSAFERRRSSLDVWVYYETDIQKVSRLLVDAISGTDGVHSDPAPYVIPSGFEDGRCLLVLKWWHDPDLKTEERILGSVATVVKATLDDAGFAIAPPAAIFLSEPPTTGSIS